MILNREESHQLGVFSRFLQLLKMDERMGVGSVNGGSEIEGCVNMGSRWWQPLVSRVGEK